MIALDLNGRPIRCDGCGCPVERVTEDMTRPVPDDVAATNYGREPGSGLVYIVCAPLPDGSQPCLVLAELNESLYDQVRCRIPGCTGQHCSRGGRG